MLAVCFSCVIRFVIWSFGFSSLPGFVPGELDSVTAVVSRVVMGGLISGLVIALGVWWDAGLMYDFRLVLGGGRCFSFVVVTAVSFWQGLALCSLGGRGFSGVVVGGTG